MWNKIKEAIEDWLGDPFKLHLANNNDDKTNYEAEVILRVVNSSNGVQNGLFMATDTFQLEFLLPIDKERNAKLMAQISAMCNQYNMYQFTLEDSDYMFNIGFSNPSSGSKLINNGEEYATALVIGTLQYTDKLDLSTNTTVKIALNSSEPNTPIKGFFKTDATRSANLTAAAYNDGTVHTKPTGYSFAITMDGYVIKSDSQYQLLKQWFYDTLDRNTSFNVWYSDGEDTLHTIMKVADMTIMALSGDYSKVEVKFLEV